MKLVQKLVSDYCHENKGLVSSFLLVCCFQYVLNIIVTSHVYSKFFKPDTDMKVNLRNVCVLWVAKFIVASVKAQIEERIFPEFTAFLRHQLFCLYMKANQVQFDDVNVSGDVRDMLELSRMIRDLFGWIAQTMIPTAVFLVVIILYFFREFPVVGGITGVSTAINIWLGLKNYESLVKDIDEKHRASQLVNDKFEESLQNLMNVFINNKEQSCMQENYEREQNFLPISKQEQRDIKSTSNSMRLTTYVSSAVSLIYLYKFAPFESFINFLFMFTFYISTLESLLEDLPNMVRLVSRIEMDQHALTKKIFHKLERQEQTFLQNALAMYHGGIQFRDVCFSYDGKHNVIENLNWVIRPGERVALVAKSGSGKTTLMKLLLKFYQPMSGTIYLDHHCLSMLDPSEIRSKINYVNQRTLLFQDTILANMKYGNTYTDEQIIDILKKYNLLHLFRDCDKNPQNCLYNQVDPNGTNMSMGMQKVVFLIRGLLRPHSPVCVLDEPLSSIDPTSRNSVMSMIQDLVGNRTLIVITHDDLSSIVNQTIHLDKLQKKILIDKTNEYIETQSGATVC